jgi:hypothetical protein
VCSRDSKVSARSIYHSTAVEDNQHRSDHDHSTVHRLSSRHCALDLVSCKKATLWPETRRRCAGDLSVGASAAPSHNFNLLSKRGSHTGAPATAESHKPTSMALFLAHTPQTVQLLRQLMLPPSPLPSTTLSVSSTLFHCSSLTSCVLNCSSHRSRGPCSILSFDIRFCFHYSRLAIPRSLNTSDLQLSNTRSLLTGRPPAIPGCSPFDYRYIRTLRTTILRGTVRLVQGASLPCH